MKTEFEVDIISDFLSFSNISITSREKFFQHSLTAFDDWKTKLVWRKTLEHNTW